MASPRNLPAMPSQLFCEVDDVALAEPTRRRVVDWLREGPRRAGELADAATLAQRS